MRSNLPVIVLSLLAASLVSACQAAIIRAPGVIDEGPPDEIEDPARFFADNVEPILVAQCSTCHTDEVTSLGTAFLDPGGDYYTSVRAWPDLIIPGNGAESTLVLKVTSLPHRGGMVSTNDAAIIRRWIDAEGESITPPPPPPDDFVVTGFYPIDEGENRIPLAEVGLPGSEMVFTAMYINSGVNLLMTNVELLAGTGGASIVHPRFVVQDDTDETSWEDRDAFDTLTLRVSQSMTGTVASTHVIAPFPATGSIAIQFESAQVPSTM